MTKSTIFCKKKSRNVGKRIFKSDKKIIKHVAKKSFTSGLGGAYVRPPNTLKLFFGEMFCKYLSMLMKNVFLIIKKKTSQ